MVKVCCYKLQLTLLQGGETDASLEAGGEDERPESLLLEAA